MNSHEVDHAREMLEQIAANYAWDEDAARAAAAVASHVTRFWPPGMRHRLASAVAAGEYALSPLAAAALQKAEAGA